MRLRDINPADIAAIHVDRLEDGVLIPHVLENRERWLAGMGHKEVTGAGRLLCGDRFRILLRPRQVTVTTGKSVSSSAAFQHNL